MNILFLTIAKFDSIEAHSIYADLLRCFRNHGHKVYVLSPHERKTGKHTEFIHENGANILHLATGDVTGASNLIKKGLSQISLEPLYIKAIKQYFSDVKFDLVLYSTPPITFSKAIEYVKKRDGAKSYLLLKDIFPQNAVDIGLMAKKGLKGLIYKYFRAKEKKLYSLSDRIGCMSEANVKYVVAHNPEIDPSKVEISPNTIEVFDHSIDSETQRRIREKYNIPLDKTVFVYGGNLGKPQGIPFIIECLDKCRAINEAFFLIIGDGTEYELIEEYTKKSNQNNLALMRFIPKEDYDTLVAACNVGLVFLDHRFTIPNYPSRILSYMQAKLPVLAATDPNTDVGRTIVEGDFGWWCESNNSDSFRSLVLQAIKADLKPMGIIAFEFLMNNYNALDCCKHLITVYKQT